MENIGRVGFSEEQADLLEIATNFCREKSPIETVRRLIETDTGFEQSVWQEMVDLGWLGISIPEEFGGVGLGLAEVVPVLEQMGRNMMASPYLSTVLASEALLAGGTAAQKTAILPQLATGTVATLAVMEADGDWDVSRPATLATRDGDGFLLSGTKIFVCDAMVADYLIVSASLEGEARLFLVARSALSQDALRRETIIDETKRSYEVTFEKVKLPEDAMLDPAKMAATLSHIHLVACLLSSAETCGGTQSVIDYTVEYLNTRKQFGKLIGAYQGLKHPTVDAFVLYEQARSHLYSAAHCFNEQGTGEVATRMARAQADMALSFAADRSIQFHGGFGFTYDCDAQLYRRRAIWHAAQYGDATYHKKRLAELLLS